MPREHPDPAPGQVWLIDTAMAVFIIRDRQKENELRAVWFNSHVTAVVGSEGLVTVAPQVGGLKKWLKKATYVGTPDWLGLYKRLEEEYGKDT